MSTKASQTSAASSSAQGPPARGLTDLQAVDLNDRHAWLLDMASANCQGPAAWRRRKVAEARDVLSLAEIAPRLEIGFVDLRTDLRTLVRLRTPVPCLPDGASDLCVAGEAVLGITYPQEALWKVMPGFAFVQLLSPVECWHPNVASGPNQRACLGAQIPAGTRLRELILLSYGLLTLQSVTVDPGDPAGVMRLEAAEWWSQNLDRAPLSKVPFLGTEDLEGVDDTAADITDDKPVDDHSGLPYWSRRPNHSIRRSGS